MARASEPDRPPKENRRGAQKEEAENTTEKLQNNSRNANVDQEGKWPKKKICGY